MIHGSVVLLVILEYRVYSFFKRKNTQHVPKMICNSEFFFSDVAALMASQVGCCWSSPAQLKEVLEGVVAVGPRQVSRAVKSPSCAVWSWSQPSGGVGAELLSRDGGRVHGAGGWLLHRGTAAGHGVPRESPCWRCLWRSGRGCEGAEKTQTAPPPSTELTRRRTRSFSIS